MKTTIAIVALLPALSAASCLAERGQSQLPTVDIQALSPDQYTGTGSEQAGPSADTEKSASTQVCTGWLCDGRCCPYNICCTLECCAPGTQFCSNGLCYRYV